MTLEYQHVDVFAPGPYQGNSLAVFPDAAQITTDQMAAITRELRHFESVFLVPGDKPGESFARVFDLFGELDFAGHPVIGAAVTLHALHGTSTQEQSTLHLPDRTVSVNTVRLGPLSYSAVLDQGPASFIGTPDPNRRSEFAAWFSLQESDLDSAFDPEVISTGLRYLILPVRGEALGRARIAVPDLEIRLKDLGAQFAYLLDVAGREGRHWNNDGALEDVATGSAAGCVAAYLRYRNVTADGEAAVLRQGRFTGRPSEMTVRAHGHATTITSVEVGGMVAMVGEGRLHMLPDATGQVTQDAR